MNFDHVPTSDIFVFCVSCGMLIMLFVLRKTEVDGIPRIAKYAFMSVVGIFSIFLAIFVIRHGQFISRECRSFEHNVERLLTSEKEFSIKVNGHDVEEQQSFLGLISRIAATDHKKTGYRVRFRAEIQSDDNSWLFELREDSKIKNEFWLIVFPEGSKTEGAKIGTICSKELKDMLEKYKYRKSL